jgi:hypothetical protein
MPLGNQFYVAPDGSPSGDGSINNPWDLQTALSQPAAVQPGDVIWVQGGTYVGNFVSYLSGTVNSPIVVREYPGERATLDGNTATPTSATLTVDGQYTWFWDLEITNSNPIRVVDYSGSDGPRGDGVDNFGVGTKLIDLVIHDEGNGIGDWSTGLNPSNTEVYGCIIYDNGWIGTDRAHGHGIYAQNQTGTETFTDNISFDSFDYNFHAYTEGGYINNMDLDGNDFFNSGALGGYATTDILVGGLQVAQNPTLSDNSVYDNTGGTALAIGYSAGDTNVSLTDNYLSSSSGAAISAVNSTFSAVSGNLFNGDLDQSGGSQDFITGNTYIPAGTNPTQNQIFVRPNVYEPGRANITVFNWQDLQAVSVDISSAGLSVGQDFEVVDTQNFFGGPILTGVYTGGVISLPMTGTAVAQPVGDAPFPAVHTGIGYGSFVLLPVTTNQAGTTTALTSSLSSSVYGQSVTFTATVSPVAPGGGTPTGTVEFFDGTTELDTETLDNTGTATFTTTALVAGSHAITVQYLGDSNFSGSTSLAVTQTVNQADTTTALVGGPSPSVYGQMVTFTATVSPVAPGGGTPTGTVAFQEGSSVLSTETLGASGTVSFTTSALPVGSNSITAVYSGDSNFVMSSSSTIETVNEAGTTTSLSATPASTNAGQPVTLTVTIAVVAPGAGTPMGSVQFFVGTTSLGTASLSGNSAILMTTTLPVGTDSLTAQYLGDSNFTVSTSSAVSVTINPSGIATTTTLTSSTNPSIFGQSVNLTATVAPSSGSGTPTGSVTFYAGSTPLGTATLSSKKASLKTTSVPVGSQAITAVYSGDTNYAPSTSAVLTQRVNQDSTTTKVTSSANPSVYGQSVTLTATVKAASPGSGSPTGTVTFYDGTTNLGSGNLSGGKATLPTTFFIVGSHSITADYSGDPDFTASTSSALTQTVNQAGTATAVVSLVDPSVYGQQLTFTASVSTNSPGSGTPTGTITFYSGSTQLGTGTLSGGTASLTTSSLLSVGNHTIKASYSGGTNFKASAGTLTQTVNQDSTTTSVVSSRTHRGAGLQPAQSRSCGTTTLGTAATKVSPTTNSLTWTVNSNNQTGFAIERATYNGVTGKLGPWSVIGRVGVGVTHFNDTTASRWWSSSYRIRSFSGLGYSAYVYWKPSLG